MKYKQLTIFLVILALVISVVILFVTNYRDKPPTASIDDPLYLLTQEGAADTEDIVVVAENLNIPWDLAFLPTGEILVTERPGNLLIIKPGGERSVIAVDNIQDQGEGGLLGLTLHPDFVNNNFLYLYKTVRNNQGETINQVWRYRYSDNELTEARLILDNIPGGVYHDGGRLAFGPDNFLYISTGDATIPSLAQDINSLAGKILRVDDEGNPLTDNPFYEQDGLSVYIWSYGHRNPQGLAWDGAGQLWQTEHGRSGNASGLDELNLIIPGANYGWPDSEGDRVLAGTVGPVKHSGASTTWAPASLAYFNGSLFFGGLRGETLYQAVLEGEKVVDFREHGQRLWGRIRTVKLGPDNYLYITTSNTDGRGQVKAGDDKIIKIRGAFFD